MNILFVVTRRGSSRLSGKNTRMFFGEPLASRGLGQASRCPLADVVWCLSDDPEVMDMAVAHHVRTMWLPEHLTTGNVNPTKGVMWAIEHGGCAAPDDRIGLVPVTNPLREDGDIIRCFESLDAGFDSAVTVIRRIGDFFGTIDDNGTYHPTWCVEEPPRTQDLEPTYFLNGGVYVTTADRLLRDRTWLSGRVAGVEIPQYRMDDIDTLEDLERCEMMARVLSEVKRDRGAS